MKDIICKRCGSDEVVRDAWARWDFAKQEWIVDDLFGDYYCRSCEGECEISEDGPEEEPSS